MVLNMGSNWKENSKPRHETRDKKAQKKLFTKATSGSRMGWSVEGQNIFHAVCLEVEKLRKNNGTGRGFEEGLLDHYRANCPRYKARLERQKKASTISFPVEDEPNCYVGDGLMEMFGDEAAPEDALEIVPM